MNSRLTWIYAVFAIALLRFENTTAVAAQDPAQPNIVFLLADDLGWTGLRSFGSDFYETPNLDRLAAEGMKFTNAYSACTVCSPTRASIMTGLYPARLRLTDFITGQNRPWAKLIIPAWTKFLDHRYTTIAEALNEAGYATAHVGKWHLDRRGPLQDQYEPADHGFNLQVLKPKEARGFFLPKGFNADGESRSDYLTDYLTDRALAFIDEKRNQPFFLYFAYHVPHTPIQGRADLVKRFRGRVQSDAIHKNANYAAMVSSLDQSAGRILERLKRHGIEDRTLVVFTSDNGGLTQRYGKHDGFTDNIPLRRGKGSAYEGGVRVPAIIRWPGITHPGSVCHEPVMTIDYFPTLLEIAGIPIAAVQKNSIDGLSLVGLLTNPQATLNRNLYWHYPHYHAGGDGPYSAIRSGPWRLIEFHEDNRLELYNLTDDLGETVSLADRMPEEAHRLHNELIAWRKRVNAQMPALNPNYDASRATEVAR